MRWPSISIANMKRLTSTKLSCLTQWVEKEREKMERKEEKDGLLKGIEILDLADEKASFGSKLLADLGARVIKIEKPGGDPSRGIGPFWGNSPHPERSLFFYHTNTNKLGITLDLEHPVGREIFCRLIRRTDIVVETFPPGYLSKFGLDFEILKEINPKLILVSVTNFGQNGPRSQYKSCDLVASAFGGQMYVSGSPLTPPLKPFGEQSYYTASLFAAISILLALSKRVHSGKGEHVDISLQEAVVSTVEHVMVRYFSEKIIPKRQGSLHWNNSFCVLSCEDGPILLTLFHQWATLVEWMDSEGMAEDLIDERYKEEDYRHQHIDHIIEVLQRWTKTHEKNELFELGQLMGFPWASVHSPREIVNSPQFQKRRFFVNVNHPEMDVFIKYPGVPYQFSGYSSTQWKRAPLIGEDNVQIYQKELGLSEEELKRLFSMKVV
jgi:crotonobetainyl-CoA:carnitine CoA-transferase CaiB-like acyl-CoA transferase